jgi:protein O-mannosyl-transferase
LEWLRYTDSIAMTLSAPPGSSDEPRNSTGATVGRSVWYLPLAVGLVTFAAFAPALRNGFVDWDDGYLYISNPHWRGLGWSQIRWMFTTPLLENYVPIAWLTLGFDYIFWGLRPVGYHLTNLLLHSGSAALLYVIATRLLARAAGLTGWPLQAGAVASALFFSLHPLRVESVAWISERRDVLSGILFLATILLYLDSTEASGSRQRRLLLASLGTYVLAIGSKVLVVTLPLTLILLDIYPLRRLPLDPRRWFERSHRPLWLEKLSYFVLGATGAAIAYTILHRDGAVQILPFGDALGKFAFALWFHFRTTVVPIGLSPLYELPPRMDPLAAPFLVAGIGVIAVTVAAILLVRTWPAVLIVWAHHIIVLAPVSGIAHAGFQLTADRFSYLAGPGWALLVGAGAGVLVRTAQGRGREAIVARGGAVIVALWLFVLGYLSWQQTQIWRTTETLWHAAISEAPDCAKCHATFGSWLMGHGQEMAGLEHLYQASILRPDRPMAYGLLGQAYAQVGRLPEAVAAYRQELALRPHMTEAQMGLGTVLIRIGRPAEAIPYLEAVIRLNPRAGVPHMALAEAYLALGDLDRARAQHEMLRELDPVEAARLGNRIAAATQSR